MFPFNLGPGEAIVIGIIALLVFGKKLPEVARSLGKGFVEFKKGLTGIEEEIHQTAYKSDAPSSTSSHRPAPADERAEVVAPKFEPPTGSPT